MHSTGSLYKYSAFTAYATATQTKSRNKAQYISEFCRNRLGDGSIVKSSEHAELKKAISKLLLLSTQDPFHKRWPASVSDEVASGNKTARMIWALLANGKAYSPVNAPA
ncbi:MAG TPA: hypothetical protein VEC35_17065 [Noviherbaspirillum sp.]|nr:hypothetical protein [Noviherbaspirillum sp.]